MSSMSAQCQGKQTKSRTYSYCGFWFYSEKRGQVIPQAAGCDRPQRLFQRVLVKAETGVLWWNFSHMHMKTLQWRTSEEDGSLLWCFGMWFRDCECSSWPTLWLALWGCMHQCIYCSPMSVWNSEATSDLPIYWHHQLNNTTYENISPALKLEPASLSWI